MRLKQAYAICKKYYKLIDSIGSRDMEDFLEFEAQTGELQHAIEEISQIEYLKGTCDSIKKILYYILKSV